jgi:hypothetical protein
VAVPKNTKETCLNDYRPVALMSVAMKNFGRLVTSTPLSSTDDAITIILHTALSHLDKRNTYSGKKKYVNPLEIPGFLHKLAIKCDLIFI